MKFEYVGLSASENVYGQKYLLYSELELLNLVNGLKGFRKARSEEFVLKVALRGKIAAALVALEKLEKNLPKTHYKAEKYLVKTVKEEKENLTLQQEIENIRERLRRLGA